MNSPQRTACLAKVNANGPFFFTYRKFSNEADTGHRNPEPGIRNPESGNWKPETGQTFIKSYSRTAQPLRDND